MSRRAIMLLMLVPLPMASTPATVERHMSLGARIVHRVCQRGPPRQSRLVLPGCRAGWSAEGPGGGSSKTGDGGAGTPRIRSFSAWTRAVRLDNHGDCRDGSWRPGSCPLAARFRRGWLILARSEPLAAPSRLVSAEDGSSWRAASPLVARFRRGWLILPRSEPLAAPSRLVSAEDGSSCRAASPLAARFRRGWLILPRSELSAPQGRLQPAAGPPKRHASGAVGGRPRRAAGPRECCGGA